MEKKKMLELLDRIRERVATDVYFEPIDSDLIVDDLQKVIEEVE